MMEKVFGLDEQGTEADGAFDRATGAGYMYIVPARDGDYKRARETCDVRLLLFETFGGVGDGVVHLLSLLADEVSNRLSHAQYDQTSWSAHIWRTYQTQRLSE